MKYLLSILGVLLMAGLAFGAGSVSVKADWSYDQALVTSQGITGFRVKDAGGKVVSDNILPTLRTTTFVVTNDGKSCASYYLTAFTKDDETGPSNILTYCPPRKPLVGVGTINMTFTEQ